MPFLVMRRQNFQVLFKWPEEEYDACSAFNLIHYLYLIMFLNLNQGKFVLKILADSMGLGKTIMTISLLLTHSERGGSLGSRYTCQTPNGNGEGSVLSEKSPTPPKEEARFSGFDKLLKRRISLTSGGNLIVCPMTLIGQWKVCCTCTANNCCFLVEWEVTSIAIWLC